MGILDIFGKKEVAGDLGKKIPYMISTSFTPYRLKSKEQSSTTLSLSLKNMTGEPVMSSIVVELPRQLSFDRVGMAKQKELRFGTMIENETKMGSVEVFGNVGTDKGSYTLTITAFIHYRDYGHVINEMRKRLTLDVV